MPLKPGKKNIGANISELHGGKTHAKTQAKFGKQKADKQSVAIAMNTAGKSQSAHKARHSRKPPPNASKSDWFWGS